jgi:DNA-binding transcriptional LysR family regulator
MPVSTFAIKYANRNPSLLQTDTMQDLESLAIFVRIAEMASFTHAAQSLGIQKGRASNVVRRIEASVGARLLHRSTRSVQLTEDGRAFYTRARALLADAEELNAMFAASDATMRGRLRVDLPTELARGTIVPALPSFMAAYPDVQLEISSTDRRIDLIQEGMDCAIRIGAIVDETLVARRIGALRMVNVASPAYLQRHGVPRTLHDLLAQGHRMVHYASTLGSRPFGWEYPQADGHGYGTLALAGSVSVNSVQTYHAAGLAGLGLIQAGLSSLTEYLARGELVEVLPELRPEPLPVSFVVAHRQNLSRRVGVFMEWAGQILAPYLDR